jgi:dienelactone hydrolase
VLRRVLLVVVALLVCAACATTTGAPAPLIEVNEPVALVDEAVHLRVTGLAAGERVEIGLEGPAADGVQWRSSGIWRADDDGVVDLREDPPLTGSYAGADGMGLFWSMAPPPGSGSGGSGAMVPPGAGEPFGLAVTARADGRAPARRELVRRWLADGVTARALTTAADGVAGVLYLPAAGAPTRPPVLVIGGSEPVPPLPTAALLASRGFPALALDHVGGEGLPATLRRVPLEYFATAADVLRRASGSGRVAVVGYSRGSEAALLLSHHRPDLVRGTVLCAPNDGVWPAFPPPGDAWTLAGRPVPPGPIPVDGVTGPVLTVSGGRDRTWDSTAQARRIVDALAAAGVAHRFLDHPGAGHHVGQHPHLPFGPDGADADSRAADAAARADAWPQIVELLASS